MSVTVLGIEWYYGQDRISPVHSPSDYSLIVLGNRNMISSDACAGVDLIYQNDNPCYMIVFLYISQNSWPHGFICT